MQTTKPLAKLREQATIPSFHLGTPHLHYDILGSTNTAARELASSGAPHGTLVTTRHQSEGRGRQGRQWLSPPRGGLFMSLILREYDELLPLRAAMAVVALTNSQAMVKWPNDVLLEGRKVAGILVETRPQEQWAVVGIGINFAVTLTDIPAELRARAGTLGRELSEIETGIHDLTYLLAKYLILEDAALLSELRKCDLLLNQQINWNAGSGTAIGLDDRGHLIVRKDDGDIIKLGAGEVHLTSRNY
jgi:BirA family transcriptional regulator, biotin operon repressor / biotin---[acetyl-CoA-carboxylase] ligase